MKHTASCVLEPGNWGEAQTWGTGVEFPTVPTSVQLLSRFQESGIVDARCLWSDLLEILSTYPSH